jgi:hypothetical protein
MGIRPRSCGCREVFGPATAAVVAAVAVAALQLDDVAGEGEQKQDERQGEDRSCISRWYPGDECQKHCERLEGTDCLPSCARREGSAKVGQKLAGGLKSVVRGSDTKGPRPDRGRSCKR